MRASWDAFLGIWRADGDEWRLSERAAWVLAILPIALALVGVVTFPFRGLYAVVADEDGVVEWTQFVVLVLLVIAYAHVALLLWRGDRRRLAAFYLAAMLATIFIAGEEISWGQRVLGFATPDSLEEINAQGETNIHNIGMITKAFNLVVVAICAAAVALPILRWTGWRSATRTLTGYAFIPPLALVPAFAFPFVHRIFRWAFLPEAGERVTEYGEFAELSFYFALFMFALLLRRILLDMAAERRPSSASSVRPGTSTTANQPSMSNAERH